MQSSLLLLGFSALAHAQVSQVQGPAPPPVLLNTTKSGVIPILPTATPFMGVLTNEGAIINPGPPVPGFVGPGGTATSQSNLPAATYRADLPSAMFNPFVGSTIRGSISGVGTPSGVRITVNLTNLPSQAQYGPFAWHVHTLAVPADGNCTSTMGHLDPYNRGELYMCDTANPQTCQVGDFSGKRGKIMTEGNFSTSFVDPYLSTNSSSRAFFGGLGFVIHTGNTTRLTCANFVQVGGNGTAGGMNATSTTSRPTATATAPSQFTGAAGKASAGVLALGAGLAAFFL